MTTRNLAISWLIFLCIEAVAVVSWFGWSFFSSKLGEVMWVAQLILLMPGSLIAAPIIEHLLWQHDFSLLAIGIAELVGSLVVNTVVWLLALFVVRRVRLARAL